MTEREKLIVELNNMKMIASRILPVSKVADFILADRKRIVEPLVNLKNAIIQSGDMWLDAPMENAIDETLKRA